MIQRYSFGRCKLHFDPHVCLCGKVPHPSGDYVLFADHEAQVADLQAQLSSTIQQHEAAAVEMRTKYEALEKERNALAHELGRHASIEEKAHLQTIDERDAAEECLSQMYYLITGNSPEWSNLFGHVEALQDADDAQRCLRAEVKALEKEVEQLRREVTVADLKKHGVQGLCAVSTVRAVNAIIAARAEPQKEQK